MRASLAGVNSNTANRVLDHFESVYNYNGYIRAKYDGLVPENYPTREQIKSVSEEITYHKSQRNYDAVRATVHKRDVLMRPVKAFNKEWLRQQ